METTMKFEIIEGATPIDPNEADGLIPKHLQTQSELNAFEHLNISLAMPWAFSQKNILSIKTIKLLHKKMFHQVWSWAGQYRKTQKNIGVEAYRIETELYQLCEDVQFQIENNSFHIDEIAARFHHRLVLIHPFSNGNGRHARLSTDILLKSTKNEVFSWGSKLFSSQNLTSANELRKIYLDALRQADKGYIDQLLKFVRL